MPAPLNFTAVVTDISSKALVTLQNASICGRHLGGVTKIHFLQNACFWGVAPERLLLFGSSANFDRVRVLRTRFSPEIRRQSRKGRHHLGCCKCIRGVMTATATATPDEQENYDQRNHDC
jgi:hypothetical protein